MKVSELGEFGLIDRLSKAFDETYDHKSSAAGPQIIVGNGDDAAAWVAQPGTTAFTCDAIADGSHFDLGRSTPEDVGWRAIVACQSDVAAMGLAPSFATVTLGLTGDEDVEMLMRVYEGMAQACSLHGGRVVGGDVVKAGTFVISVAMVGVDPAPPGVTPTRPMTRDCAQAGEIVAVTGPVGGSAGGLELLETGEGEGGDAAASLIRAHQRPMPRVTTGLLLAKEGVRCAIDVSDGLVTDLDRISSASGFGAVIALDDLPTHPALRESFPEQWMQMALAGGEDYGILFTATSEVVARVRSADSSICPIGRIIDGPPGVRVLTGNGGEVKAGSGFEHFGT